MRDFTEIPKLTRLRNLGVAVESVGIDGARADVIRESGREGCRQLRSSASRWRAGAGAARRGRVGTGPDSDASHRLLEFVRAVLGPLWLLNSSQEVPFTSFSSSLKADS